jgi:hypothetical protein
VKKMLLRIISDIEKEFDSQPFTWAQRHTPFWMYKRKDNNLFTISSTLFILQGFLAPKILHSLHSKITALYPHYQNKDGRATYNFYPTKPSRHFPYGLLMQHLDHFRLPDDIDDTALVYLTLPADTTAVSALKDICEVFAHADKTRLYSTWFGKNMPHEQDLCALINLLQLFSTHNLALSPTDESTYEHLKAALPAVRSRAFELSRHYGSPALILYHYARLITACDTPLSSCRNLLIQELLHQREVEKVPMNILLLETSLLKLGEKRSPLPTPTPSEKGFHTFIGAPFAPYPYALTKKWAAKPAYQMFWHAKMHNLALQAEYLHYSGLNPPS